MTNDLFEEYYKQFPVDIQDKLRAIENYITELVPEASKKIRYQMPTFYLNGNLIHFAAFKNHLSLFGGGEVTTVFKDDLKEYKTSKGTIQIPLNQDIPFDLIKKIVEYRVKQNK